MLLAWLACTTEAVPAPDVAPSADTVRSAFPPPEGFTRALGDAFGDWLGERPLRAADAPVRTHDGRIVGHRARVVDLPLVPGDLQQCADSLIRLRAEWLREQGRPVSFSATSGDALPWSRWEAGERPFVVADHVRWRPGQAGGFEEYLAAVFTWAGTRSLEAYETVPADDPLPGDVLVEGGSPGHAVILLDVARRDDELVVLVGEGFMPAQDFHVELGPVDGWWPYEDGVALPHWPMPDRALRRWR